MKFLLKMAFIILLMPLLSYASNQTAVVDSIQALNDGRIVVNLVGTRTGKPNCATYDYWFIADENSVAGKAQLGLLLEAHASGKQVILQGTGTCVRWVDGENIIAVTVLRQ